ncbi:MAG: glycosyltransferase [Sphingomonas oligoaromativorans]
MNGQPPPRIAFLLSSLKFGGGERVALYLAAALQRRGYAIDILLMQSAGELLEEAARGFTVVDLRCERTWRLPGRLVRYLRERRPVALISSFWKLNLCACLGRIASPGTRLLVWEHSPPSRSANSPRWAYFLSASVLYRLATKVIAVSGGVARDVRGMTIGLDGRVVPIFNPVPPPPQSSMARAQGPGKRILWIGRLDRPKNPGLMIDAFTRMRGKDLHLDILGDGPLRSSLEERVQVLGMSRQIRFLGFQPSPYDHMEQADLLALSSDREGLPTVLIEALHAGLAIVSTDCGDGVREILMDGHHGAIVPTGDAAALAAAIERQLACPPDPDSQRAAARRFDPDRIAGKFLAALGLSDADMAQNQPLTPATKLAEDILSPSARA